MAWLRGRTIDGSSVSGIILSPELWWNEACYSRNVVIRNNIIRNLPANPRSYGAIAIAAITDRPVSGYGHQHIVVEGNQIENCNGVNLLITSAQDVTVRNNRFTNPQSVATAVPGASWGEDAGALVYVTESANVRLQGNTASGLGPAHRRLVAATPTAKQIESDWK